MAGKAADKHGWTGADRFGRIGHASQPPREGESGAAFRGPANAVRGSRNRTDPRRTIFTTGCASPWRVSEESEGEEEPMRRRDHEDALRSAAAGCVGRPARGRPNREGGALRRHRLLQLQQRPMLQGTVLLHLVSEAMPLL